MIIQMTLPALMQVYLLKIQASIIATPGWENRGNVIDFNAWLQAALEDARRDKEDMQ